MLFRSIRKAKRAADEKAKAEWEARVEREYYAPHRWLKKMRAAGFSDEEVGQIQRAIRAEKDAAGRIAQGATGTCPTCGQELPGTGKTKGAQA